MFGDYVKMGAKAVALVAGVALIIVLFSTIQIPSLDLSAVSSYIDTAYSVGVHYVPMFSVLWTLGLVILDLNVAIIGVRLALIAIKWVLKVNE